MNNPDILLVEDNLDIVKVISSNLNHNNYNTIIANTGTEAVSKVAGLVRKVKVGLFDTELPDMKGYEIYQKIRENPYCADMYVIAMSGDFYGEKGTIFKKKWEEQGVKDFLDKPFNFSEFLKRIDVLMMS